MSIWRYFRSWTHVWKKTSFFDNEFFYEKKKSKSNVECDDVTFVHYLNNIEFIDDDEKKNVTSACDVEKRWLWHYQNIKKYVKHFVFALHSKNTFFIKNQLKK